MLQIEFELKKMCREHRVDGRTTQGDRMELAATIARDLDACGYHRFSRQKNCSRKLKDKHVRGLVQHWRGKEALMIQPAWADRGNRIVLHGTWTKGGRQREIPLTTAAQRQTLDHARAVAGKASLIPPSLSYKAYRDGLWQSSCKSIGLTGTHGFRHAYAQDRYEALVGFPCPVRGGPMRDAMTAEQLQLDEWARNRVSSELGHGRHRVTNWYLGKG